MATVAETAGSFGHEIERSGAPLISVQGIWKIFGRNADRIVGTADADLSRSELRAKHNCVAAVRDVSFDVWPREVDRKSTRLNSSHSLPSRMPSSA